MKLSVIVPCYNEVEVLPELAARLETVLAQCRQKKALDDYEIIMVDDGSTDGSFDRLSQLAHKNHHWKVISFWRNYGHQTAIAAGLDRAAGDAAVIIDADLQDPPELIGPMLAKWREGFKIVHAVRRRRLGETFLKRVGARFYYRLINFLSEVKFPAESGDFKLLDRQVVDYLKNLKEHHKYIRGLVVFPGFSQVCLDFVRQPRLKGRTKYSFFRSLGLGLDGIISFSSRTLRLITFLGLVGLAGGFLLGLYTLHAWLLTPAKIIPGWASLIMTMVFFGSLQLLSLGVIGEYLLKIFEEVRGRPAYLVREKINFEDEK